MGRCGRGFSLPGKTPGRRRGRSAFAGLLLLAVAMSGAAQTVDTNRPGFSFTPGTVPAGRWQLESGIAHDRPDSDSRSTTAPVAELRYGLSERAEVFVSGLSWTTVDAPGGDVDGFADVTFGSKLALLSDGAWATALLLQVTAPLGDDELTSDSWDPSAAFVWTHSGALPLAGTFKVSDFDGQLQVDNSLKLPLALGGPHSMFFEWEANLPEGGDDAHWLNGGYQFLASERVQFDINFGVGLNDAAGDYRFGIGFSQLF